ncbi:transcription factor bHLH155-like isoform X2 [Abrus precatorius]|uniref:Transcription factor bHLH155-like isoform X2 n=1 Tax=Abrus precatorius TaxID=3816 RepID=A0A8B8L8Z8_ABRPR|nr:transcription factor bHLH155-like isoform X2 [Abrus precatorius]
MEATSITQLLKGFCDNTLWKYAVLWKLDHHFPMVVGKIALARDHCWFSCEDILTGKFDTDLFPECPDEWLLQFASGIKTIVLVPVHPLGVLQFGSFEEIAEDLEFITNIKDKVHSIHCPEANTAPLNLGTDYRDWSFSTLMHNLMDILNESSSVTDSILKSEVSTSATLNVNGSRLNPTMLSFIQGDCFLSGENLVKSLKRANESVIGSSSIEMLIDSKHVGKIEANPCHMEEEIWSWSHLVNNVGVFGEMSYEFGSHMGKNMTGKKFGSTETDHGVKNVNDFFNFPLESELHKALGTVAYGETGKHMSKHISVEDTYSSSTLISNEKEHGNIKGLELSKEVDPEYLLDAVVGSLCSASDDTSSLCNSVRSLISMPIKFTGCIQPKINSEESTLIVENSDMKTDNMPAVMIKGKDERSHTYTSSFDENSSLLVHEARQEKVSSHMQPVSGPKPSSASKKRTRVGNNQKSRPRDRQLIMDRMKELRELVPDGGKCSIDNLLERTIKHMLYLRKITSQAEKLKQFANREVPKCKRQKINGSHPGRSCAFDFESELAWPIVIEDLECSGNMLIEMICNEHGLFLEIAQVIRKLDLSILKGILENRSSTNWACFIVEVPRGFHRMDVLCPLLHLLQLRRKPVSYNS